MIKYYKLNGTYDKILNNYPNPFNPTTTINYIVSEKGFAKIKIYDILGKEISTLYNGVKEPGEYSIVFDGSRLSSGIYFYRLIFTPEKGGKPTITQKSMQLLK